MDTLIRFGLTIDEINNLMETNSNIESSAEKFISNNILLLKKENCTNEQIKDIILCNPFFLTIDSEELLDLINTIKEYGWKNTSTLLIRNPYLLNMSKQDFKSIIESKKEKGLKEEEIKDFLYNNIILRGEIDECSN